MRLFLLAILCCGNFSLYAQYAVGDFGSTSTGSWTTASIWSTWNGAAWVGAGASGTPTALNNVFILSGSTVTAPATGPYSTNDLTVEAGAKLWTANSGTNIYIAVYGSKFVCDGQIGDGAVFDGISFNIEGANCTLSGSGLFNASRIRKRSNFTPTTNFTISIDVNLSWGTVGSTQIYNGSTTDNTIFNVTVNSGYTLTLAGCASIDGTMGADIFQLGGTFTINGTMVIPGILYATTNNTNSTYSCNWIINGTVQASEIVASNSGTAGHSIVLNTGGKLDITGTPAWSTLGITNNNYSFNVNSTVEYSAAGDQQVRVRGEFASAASAQHEYGHLVLSGSGLKSTNNPTLPHLYIKNNLTITGSAILDPNPGTHQIWVGGNWSNYNQAGFLEKTTTVFMNGSTLQTITCPGGEVYNILRYQKTGSYLQFNNNVTVNTQLVFASNGYIDLNSNRLTVLNTATTGILNGNNNNRFIVSEKSDNSSKVTWRMNTVSGTYTIPFGVPPGGAANYIPVIVIKGANDVGDMTVSTYGTPPDNLPWPFTPTLVTNLWSDIPIHNVPDNRHWTVDRFWEVGVTNGVPLGAVTFSYRQVELPDSDQTWANMRAQHWDGLISYWNRTQFGTPAAYSVQVFGFIDFTSWTLSSVTSPLPIELLNFNARAREDYVQLDWATASEINNDYFTIEKSRDAKLWAEVARVEGAHNSSNMREYGLNDMEPYKGISYYRLKQTDFDGQYSYSDIVPVSFRNKDLSYLVFPNPASDKAFLTGPDQPATIQVLDMNGKICIQQQSEGTINAINTSDLPLGMYTIRVITDMDSQHVRLVKGRP